jgi:1-aminocyclopropane-1-carboxylate deaminase/D-cysteine desulfhydrase-like pyridoxal-dependent ACC family enzyme
MIHSSFSGNKARKFDYLLNSDLTSYKKIISHGSIQSNAMFSLSILAKYKNLEFDYYSNSISSFLLVNPHGNFKYALDNGMNIYTKDMPTLFKKDELFIPEGGYFDKAEYGVKKLALEIEAIDEKLDIFLPSGTGTTALYLQKNLQNLKVYTTPCVGDSKYLKKQFLGLCKDESKHPTILDASKKYHFGKLYSEFYKEYRDLKDSGIEFDLLYDPKGWIVLRQNCHFFKNRVLYIHQGGLIGNISMLKRYQRKFKI